MFGDCQLCWLWHLWTKTFKGHLFMGKGWKLLFHPKWFTHKFEGPRVTSEVAICMQLDKMVWIGNTFPCGVWPDKKIVWCKLINLVDKNEIVEVEGKHAGLKFHCQTHGDCLNESNNKAKDKAWTNQETSKERLKEVNSSGWNFHPNHKKQKVGPQATTVTTQVGIGTTPIIVFNQWQNRVPCFGSHCNTCKTGFSMIKQHKLWCWCKTPCCAHQQRWLFLSTCGQPNDIGQCLRVIKIDMFVLKGTCCCKPCSCCSLPSDSWTELG